MPFSVIIIGAVSHKGNATFHASGLCESVINVVLMTGKIYIKTINRRKYRYERLGSKRVGKKVITDDKCLGPVEPVTNKIGRLPAQRISHYRSLYVGGFPIPSMKEEMKDRDNVIVSETTIRNFFKDAGEKRMPQTTESRRATMEEHVEKQLEAKTKAERETQHRFNILLEEKRLTPKQITTIGKGKGLNKKMIDGFWKKRGK